MNSSGGSSVEVGGIGSESLRFFATESDEVEEEAK